MYYRKKDFRECNTFLKLEFYIAKSTYQVFGEIRELHTQCYLDVIY